MKDEIQCLSFISSKKSLPALRNGDILHLFFEKGNISLSTKQRRSLLLRHSQIEKLFIIWTFHMGKERKIL